MIAPILKYPGAKWRLASWILQHMPPHESYLEPFFGSGAVFFGKTASRIETINDLDGEVVNFFRTCRERPDELANALALTVWARDERIIAFGTDASFDAVERARRFAVRCWMTFGASLSEANGWRHTTARDHSGGPDNPKLWARMPQCVYDAAQRLKHAQIENRPALDVIRRFSGPRVLIYADPPYVRNTRTGHGDAYNHEMSDKEHVELLSALKKHTGMVLLSGYDCEMYRDMLGDWRMVSTSTTAERGARKTECLWLNRSAADAQSMLHLPTETHAYYGEAIP